MPDLITLIGMGIVCVAIWKLGTTRSDPGFVGGLLLGIIGLVVFFIGVGIA